MRYLGIDYGIKKIGTAVSDPNASFAFAKHVYDNDRGVLDKVVALVREEGVGAIVIGDAEENAIATEARAFGARLAAACGVPVDYEREAWSSFEAARFAPERQRHAPRGASHHNDAAAAAIILQRYLDRI